MGADRVLGCRQLQPRRQSRRAEWKQPGTRPAAETEAGVPRFRAVRPVHQGAAGRALRDGDGAENAVRGRGDRAGRSRPRTCRRSRDPCRRRSRSRSSMGMRSRRLTCSACSRTRWLAFIEGQALPAGTKSRGAGRTGAGVPPVDGWLAIAELPLDRVRGERCATPRPSAERSTASLTKSGLDPRTCRRPTTSRRWRRAFER